MNHDIDWGSVRYARLDRTRRAFRKGGQQMVERRPVVPDEAFVPGSVNVVQISGNFLDRNGTRLVLSGRSGQLRCNWHKHLEREL